MKHNRPMHKGRDLLSWVFGGLSMACVALAVIVSTNSPVPGISAALIPASVPVLPAAQAIVPATPPATLPATAAMAAPPPFPAPDLAAAAASAPPAAAPAAGAQIWECRTNGQRTFSDKPCGDKPVLRELSTLNVMNPTPILPTRSYQPEPSYAPEYSYPETQEPAEIGYPVLVGYPVVGYPYNNRRRPDHTHRPHPQPHRPTSKSG